MVLKIITFFLLCFSLSALAQTKSQKRFIGLASKAHAKKQYAKSNQYLKKAFNFKKTKKIPATVLYLHAVNLQKLGNHKNSIYFFSQMIKRKYLKAHIKTLKAFRADEVDGDEIPKLLKATYFYMAQSYYANFVESESITDADRAKKYFKICDDADFNDKCGDFLENINEKIEYLEKSKDSFEFFLFAGRMMINDRFRVKRTDLGETRDIYQNVDGLCYGAGLRLQNAFKGWQFSGCAFSGFAAVAESSAFSDSAGYKQTGVPIAGLYTEVGRFWRTDSESTRLGISIPVMYRSGLYSQPNDYQIIDNRKTTFGLSVSAGFQLPVVELEFKLANMQDANVAITNFLLNF